MTMLSFDSILQGFLNASVNGIWQGLLLLGLVWLVLAVLGRNREVSPSTQYAVWSMALVALVILHVVGFRSAFQEQKMDRAAELGVEEVESAWPSEAIDVQPAEFPTRVEKAEVPELQEVRESAFLLLPPPAPSTVKELPQAPPTAATGEGMSSGNMIILPEIVGVWAPYIMLAWGLLTLLFFLRLGRGLFAVSEMKSRSRIPTGRRRERLEYWLARTGIRRPVVLAESDLINTPVAAGLFRAMILIPDGLSEQLSDDEFDQVLLHELAHLSRFDDVSILVQRFLEAVFFYHPAVRWMANHLAEQREMACDAWVVDRTREPRSYVRSLKRVVELQLTANGSPFVPGMAVRKGHLKERVQRVLNLRFGPESRFSGEQVALATGLIGLVAVLLWVQAPVFGWIFGDNDREYEVVEMPPPPPVPAESMEPPPPPMPAMAAIPPAPPVPPVPSMSPMPPMPPMPPLPSLPDLPEWGSGSEAVGLSAGSGSSSGHFSPANVSEIRMESDLSVASWIKLLSVASRITSSGEKGRLLREAVRRLPDNEKVLSAYIMASESIASSSERQTAMTALLDRLDLEKIPFLEFIKSAESIGSSSSRGAVLLKVVQTMPDETKVREAAMEAAENIPSSSERATVLRALVRRGD